jgi:hypothetical protein
MFGIMKNPSKFVAQRYGLSRLLRQKVMEVTNGRQVRSVLAQAESVSKSCNRSNPSTQHPRDEGVGIDRPQSNNDLNLFVAPPRPLGSAVTQVVQEALDTLSTATDQHANLVRREVNPQSLHQPAFFI